MNVFRIAPTTPYTGGSCLIAANTIEEAEQLFCSDEYRNYIKNEYDCSCNIVKHLIYKTTIPYILFNDIYLE